jgi:hypothetical protein
MCIVNNIPEYAADTVLHLAKRNTGLYGTSPALRKLCRSPGGLPPGRGLYRVLSSVGQKKNKEKNIKPEKICM